jgi:PAS domain S-box-containing protein
MGVVDSPDQLTPDDGQRARPRRLGGLAQRVQHRVRATIDVLGQSHRQQLAAIVESSDDAIISTDVNGIIATWNQAATKLYGYAADEVVGQPITRLFPPELQDEEAGILARIRKGERVEHYETVRRRKDGRRVFISLTISPIEDATGRVVGAAKIGRDISARKRAEDIQVALFEFTDRLFRAASTHEVFDAALNAIIRALGCERASILLFDEVGVMKFVAWHHLSDTYRCAVEGHSPWTRETQDPQPIIIGDIESAELDASVGDTVKAEGIAALTFMPLTAKGELIGKFMTYYSAPHAFSQAEINVGLTIARQLGFSLERMRVEEQRKRAEDAKELLVSESRHRIKNTLATVQAMAMQTLRHVESGALEAFLARLDALGEAHELLTIDSWHQAPLREVVERALTPFALKQDGRIVAEGPPVWVPANTALALTLCLHELATNAVKYGALSTSSGRVHVAWDLADGPHQRHLRLTWQESGGPPVNPPVRSGFGSRLIRATCEDNPGLEFQPDGVRCVLTLAI